VRLAVDCQIRIRARGLRGEHTMLQARAASPTVLALSLKLTGKEQEARCFLLCCKRPCQHRPEHHLRHEEHRYFLSGDAICSAC
jgi:hypothetical protein